MTNSITKKGKLFTLLSDILLTLSNLRESVTENEQNVALLNSTEGPQNIEIIDRLTQVEQTTTGEYVIFAVNEIALPSNHNPSKVPDQNGH